MKIAERVTRFSFVFATHKKLCISFGQKSGLGYTLGDFFTNLSGHPDANI
jgi:hypothetical protein